MPQQAMNTTLTEDLVFRLLVYEQNLKLQFVGQTAVSGK